jgi:hypothetical protein
MNRDNDYREAIGRNAGYKCDAETRCIGMIPLYDVTVVDLPGEFGRAWAATYTIL